MVHDAHEQLYPNQRKEISPLLIPLYREGLAVYAVTKLFPEIGDGATGIKKSERKKANKSIPIVSKELIENIRKKTMIL